MPAKHLVGIIGCGLIGGKRAASLRKFPQSRLAVVADVDKARAQALAKECSCEYTTNWKDIATREDIDIVIVSTTNDLLAPITIEAIKNKKHVLVEKPAARNPAELKKVFAVFEKQKNVCVKVGFNHRFHPSFAKARELIETEGIGEVMFLRARYGHGGRLGYEKEWRADRKKAGGGEMLDQGSHIVDLSRYFMGDFSSAIGYCENYYWDMEVEDNCFALLRTKNGGLAQLHASCTQWKNIFSMELFCRTGQINIDGLGRSYGKETLTFYKMKPEMGPPGKKVYEWDGPDDSWEKEYADFIDAISSGRRPNGDLYDAYASLKLIDKIYSWNKLQKESPKKR
ncbi:MAG: Gfo/Idh/MocA family oxidoreductase [Candidatus Altiarchaeia archaeon]